MMIGEAIVAPVILDGGAILPMVVLLVEVFWVKDTADMVVKASSFHSMPGDILEIISQPREYCTWNKNDK